MNFKLTVVDLLDLQTSLRRSTRWVKEQMEILDESKMPETFKVLRMDLEKYEELHQKLEACFDEHYPPNQAA